MGWEAEPGQVRLGISQVSCSPRRWESGDRPFPFDDLDAAVEVEVDEEQQLLVHRNEAAGIPVVGLAAQCGGDTEGDGAQLGLCIVPNAIR